MKLSEYKGEQALDILADLMEPAAAIIADKEIASLAQRKAPNIKIVQKIVKTHKAEIIEILAVLDGENPEEYAEKVSVFTLPVKILNLLNDPELKNLFTVQGQKIDNASSGSATENTEAEKK